MDGCFNPSYMNSVLYVDDDPDDQAIFCDVLAMINPNLKCHIANGGAEAFELLEKLKEPPDYIFLDMNMPRTTGSEFLRIIKTNDSLKEIPVIIYSTSKTPVVEKESHALGAVDYLLKGVSVDEMRNTLSKFLR